MAATRVAATRVAAARVAAARAARARTARARATRARATRAPVRARREVATRDTVDWGTRVAAVEAAVEATQSEGVRAAAVGRAAKAVGMQARLARTGITAAAEAAPMEASWALKKRESMAREAIPSSLGSQRGSHSLRSRLQSRKARLWNQDHHPHTCRCG